VTFKSCTQLLHPPGSKCVYGHVTLINTSHIPNYHHLPGLSSGVTPCLLQARRIAALSSLPHLKTLWLDPDLGPEALKTLAKLPGLRELRVLGSSHLAHSGHSLQALCGLSQLTGLSFKWTGGR
jgi:hypothetical protein